MRQFFRQGCGYAIAGYRRFLSPHKGFCCASAAVYGGATCSNAVQAIVLRDGPVGGWPAIRAQFSRCRAAAEELRKEGGRQRKGRRRRRAEEGPHQNGVCDGCDVLGCGFDLPLRACAGGAAGGDGGGLLDGCGGDGDACSCG